MKLALLVVTLAAASGTDRIDRSCFLNDAGRKVRKKHDGEDDCDRADGVDCDSEIGLKYHVLGDGRKEELAERDAQEEAQDRTDDRKSEILRQVQEADLSVLDADGLHDADLSIFLRDSERKRNLKYDEGQDVTSLPS